MLVTPNFHFNGNCLEAIELYKKAFRLEVISIFKNSDANPEDYIADKSISDKVYHAEVMLGTTRMMMTDQEHEITSNPLSLVVTYDTSEEVNRAYEIIKEGARIVTPMQTTTYSSAIVSLVDKFGMRWELMTEQTER